MSALDRLLGSDRVAPFGRASRARINQYQERYGVRFSREYRTFLLRCNGMDTAFDDEARREAELHMALTDINTFYGIGNGRDHADLELIAARYDANARRLMTFAPAIAVGGDLCELVEVSRGRRAGQILYTDGELAGSFMRGADWSEPADALIEAFVDGGFFMPVAASFAELLAMYLMLV